MFPLYRNQPIGLLKNQWTVFYMREALFVDEIMMFSFFDNWRSSGVFAINFKFIKLIDLIFFYQFWKFVVLVWLWFSSGTLIRSYFADFGKVLVGSDNCNLQNMFTNSIKQPVTKNIVFFVKLFFVQLNWWYCLKVAFSAVTSSI